MFKNKIANLKKKPKVPRTTKARAILEFIKKHKPFMRRTKVHLSSEEKRLQSMSRKITPR